MLNQVQFLLQPLIIFNKLSMKIVEGLMKQLIRDNDESPIHNCILHLNNPRKNISYKHAFGHMNGSGGEVHHNYRFRAGSITKTFTATIIMQLMGAVFPQLARLQQEGEPGRQKISQYTRYLTIVICLVQGGLLALALRDSPGSLIQGFNPNSLGLNGQPFGEIVVSQSPMFFANTVVFLTTGTINPFGALTAIPISA